LASNVNIHYEKYDSSSVTEGISAYDNSLSSHYRSEGRQTQDAAWTGIIASRLSEARRPHLKKVLEDLGFRFD
ncbi:MAG: hypothetical protein ACXAD7_17265, partial [Candidatus Kariarchaeaceae archaeon]